MKKLLIALACLLITVLFIELYFRLAFSKKLGMNPPIEYVADSLLGYRYKPNIKNEFITSAFTKKYEINSYGFPGKNFSTKKAKGVCRIAVVGHSDDCGLWTSDVDYSIMLEQALKKRNLNVEVVNLSLDGTHKSIRNTKLLSKEIFLYSPDIVLLRSEFPLMEDFQYKYRTTYKNFLLKYADELCLDSAKKYVDEKLVKKDIQTRLIDYSFIYRSIVRTYLWKQDKNIILSAILSDRDKLHSYFYKTVSWGLGRTSISPREYTVEESFEILKGIQSNLAAKNIDLILFNTYESTGVSKLDSAYRANKINFIHLDIRRKEEYSFGKDDGHSSKQGHMVIAQGFAIAFEKILKGSSKYTLVNNYQQASTIVK